VTSSTVRKPTAERREEIAGAALRLIGTRGIAALTVASLAAELGLTGGALYRHFPSTDAILDAVAARAEALLDATLLADDLAPLEWLERFAEARTRTVGTHAGLARLMLSEQVAFALSPASVARLQGVVERSREAIVRALAAGQREKVVRDDVPAPALAPIVMGTMQMIAMTRAEGGVRCVPGDPMKVFHTLLALIAPVRSHHR
jgi:AcrR family transcriptional regulator